ncbi:MAG TPA: AraC family transcriptional regulator [Thermoanaerobaculia bacterium]|nr:AraC family transcriptional regulator [Thermoanaerobaculia bacterium]
MPPDPLSGAATNEGPSRTRLRRGAFEFRHLVLRQSKAFPEHRHDRPHIVLLYGGQWNDTSRSRRYDVRAGEILFHPAGFVHASAVESRTEAVIVHVDLAMTLAFCPLYGNVARDVHLPFETLRGVPERIREELTHGDEAAPVILESLAMQMMALGSRIPDAQSRVPPPWLGEALAHIRRALASPLTVRSIAAAVGISPSRLAHVFRKSMGRSVSTYIRESRVRAAAVALRETDDPISDVALRCGFYDQAHLTRVFKAMRAMTPLQYRRMHRSGSKQGR